MHLATLGSPLEFTVYFSGFEQCVAAQREFEMSTTVRFEGLKERISARIVYLMSSFNDFISEKYSLNSRLQLGTQKKKKRELPSLQIKTLIPAALG